MTTLLSRRSQSREPLDDDVDLERDRALVARAQSGDQSAFDDLYLRYHRRLHRFCIRRLHDTHEAEDVTQEAFARAWRALPNFGGDRRFYPWLSVIASHLCTDTLRRRTRTTPVAEFHQSDLASTEDGGEELMVSAVDGQMATQAFARLSDRHQRILMLREESGWSYQRIADHEGVGITAVETLLWRARQALKREFASIADGEGRMAAWLGGLVSIASFRRLLRLLHRGARHLAGGAGRGPVMALGSAAAATAMVVTASLHPATTSAPTPLPGATHNAAFIPALPTGSPGGTAVGTPSSGAGTTAPGSGAGGSVPTSGGTTIASGPGAVASVGNGLAGVTEQVGQSAGTVVNGIVGTATQLLSPLTTVNGAASALGSSVGSTLQTTVNNATSLGSDAVDGVTQTVTTVPGVPSGVSGTTTAVGNAVSSTVGTTVNKAAGAAGNLLGGL